MARKFCSGSCGLRADVYLVTIPVLVGILSGNRWDSIASVLYGGHLCYSSQLVSDDHSPRGLALPQRLPWSKSALTYPLVDLHGHRGSEVAHSPLRTTLTS